MNQATMIARRMVLQKTMIQRQARQMSSAGPVYNAVMSSNAKYVMMLVAGVAIGDAAFGFVGDAVWNMNNRGKTYDSIDWSKWESIYLEEEESDE